MRASSSATRRCGAFGDLGLFFGRLALGLRRGSSSRSRPRLQRRAASRARPRPGLLRLGDAASPARRPPCSRRDEVLPRPMRSCRLRSSTRSRQRARSSSAWCDAARVRAERFEVRFELGREVGGALLGDGGRRLELGQPLGLRRSSARAASSMRCDSSSLRRTGGPRAQLGELGLRGLEPLAGGLAFEHLRLERRDALPQARAARVDLRRAGRRPARTSPCSR